MAVDECERRLRVTKAMLANAGRCVSEHRLAVSKRVIATARQRLDKERRLMEAGPNRAR